MQMVIWPPPGEAIAPRNTTRGEVSDRSSATSIALAQKSFGSVFDHWEIHRDVSTHVRRLRTRRSVMHDMARSLADSVTVE